MSGPASDKVEIIDLLGRYAWYVNSQDSDGFASCFTEDGVWEGAGFGRMEGIEALRNMWGQRTPRNPHLPLNYVVDVDGDTATVHSDILIVGLEGGTWSITTVGAYDDRLVRVGGSWKIQYRRFTRLGIPPTA
jgi:ketosteroid isomerase-like protein